MRWGPILMCCWPGLARLWTRGHASSLLVAIGFAILLNLALVSTFLWPNSLGETFPIVAWPTLLLVWTVSGWVSFRNLPDVLAVGRQDLENKGKLTDTLFNQAQREYLGGQWAEAKTLLYRRLESEPRDIESRLLLATLLRHERDFGEAISELNTLKRFDESAFWDFEIRRERDLIEMIRSSETNDNFDEATLNAEPASEADRDTNGDSSTSLNTDSTGSADQAIAYF